MGEISYRPLIENMTWSYSRIDSFKSCPYKWYLKYIKGLKEQPQFYSSYGSFAHKIIEQYYKGEIKQEEMLIKFLFGFKDNIKGKLPKESTLKKWIRGGSEYFKNFKPFPYKMISVEKKVNFNIAGNQFVGYIDYLGEKDGELYIVDNKSADLKPRSSGKNPTVKDKELDEKLRQLYIYAFAVKQEYGKLPKSLCFNCFRTNTFIEEPFNKRAYNEAIEWAVKSIEEIKDTEEFQPNMEFFVCSHICGLNHECCYWEMR